MKELIIFDIDGTLLDSVAFNVKALNSSLEALDFEERVGEACVRAYLGCTSEEFYVGVLTGSAGECWQEIREHNRKYNGEIMLEYGKAFDGVKDTFEKLKDLGYSIALYSNCSRVYMDRAIKVVGIGGFLDYHECVKDHNIPKPDLIRKIRQHLDADRTIVVGDRIHDYDAAVANRVPCIGAMYGYGKKEMDCCPYKIYNMREIIQILEKIG